MLIKSLSLENFKTIRHAEFKFKKGVICFTGNNGEGKSTVLHAILLLLFNTTYEGTLKDSIRWGEKEFKISMEFSHEGKSYKESLTYSLTKGSDRLLTDLTTNETFSGASAISKLAEIIDPEQARAAIVSMENEQNLVTTTPSQRREYLKKIYSLEFKQELNRIAVDLESTDKDIISLNSKKDVLEGFEYSLKDELALPDKSKYEDAKEELEKLKAKKADLKLQLDKKSAIKEKFNQAEDAYRRSRVKIEEYNREERDAKGTLESYEKELIRLQEVSYTEERTNEELKLKESFDKEIQAQEKRLEEAKQKLESILPPSRISRTKINELTSRLAEINHAIKTSSSKLEILRQGKCPTCGRDIAPEEADKEAEILKGLQIDYQNVSLQVKEEEDSLTKIQNENDSRQKEKEQWELIKTTSEQKLKNLENQYENELSKLDLSYKNKYLELKNSIDSVTAKIDKEKSRLVSLSSLISEGSELVRKNLEIMEELEKEYNKLEDPSEEVARLTLEMEVPEGIIKNYENALNYNESIRVYNEEMTKKAQERDEQVAELSKQIQSLTERKAMITVAKSIIQREFPSFVISRMVQSLNNYVNEFLDKVYPKYQISIEEGKNSLNILYGDYKTDVKMASGFEKSAFSLAYMYALGKIQAYGLLICDEGDAAASDENSAKFYKMLGRSTDWLEQIMCITHKEEIKELLRNDFRAQIFTVENGEYKEEIA